MASGRDELTILVSSLISIQVYASGRTVHVGFLSPRGDQWDFRSYEDNNSFGID